jgi:GDPmannose 4,6-dehydratase
LDSKRDWGYAKDYVEAMWLMLQQEKPEDFVIATGETHSVKEFLQLACQVAGIDDWQAVYKHNPIFDRPAEVDMLIGDASKAKRQLNWQPSVDFAGLVKLMVEAELEEEAKLKS